jgi:hypothetical protein
VIESSGFLLSIRGVRVTKNQVGLLVVYPKRPKPVRCCFGVKKDTASFKDDLIQDDLEPNAFDGHGFHAHLRHQSLVSEPIAFPGLPLEPILPRSP